MQIIGLGTDIVEVKRIEILAQKPGALSRLFTQHELDYSLARKNKYEHLAARFAARNVSGYSGDIAGAFRQQITNKISHF